MKPRRTTGKSDNSDRRNRSINSVNDGLFDTASSTNIQRDKSLFYDRWKVKETLQKNCDRSIMEIACDKFNHLIRECVSYV